SRRKALVASQRVKPTQINNRANHQGYGQCSERINKYAAHHQLNVHQAITKNRIAEGQRNQHQWQNSRVREPGIILSSCEVAKTVQNGERCYRQHRAPHHPFHLLPNDRALCFDRSTNQQGRARNQSNDEMNEAQPVKEANEGIRQRRQLVQSGEQRSNYTTEENESSENQQPSRRNIKPCRRPAVVTKQTLSRGIASTEM